MLATLQNIIYKHLSRNSFRSDEELSLYMMMCVAILFSGFMHVILLLIFVFSSVLPLVLVNVGSILIYGICLFAVRKRAYLLAGLLMAVEIISYVFISIYFAGNQNYIVMYFFILLTLQLLMPYASIWVRGVLIGLIWLCLIAASLWGANLTPVYDLGLVNIVLMILNVNIAFFATLIELSISNSIRKVIDHYNKDKSDEFRSQAYTDPLTGLYNRRYADIFFEKVKDNQTQHWCVAMLDLDDFKQINDSYGHAVGDIVLSTLSAHISNSLRKSDVVFRWGGEEFLILLEDVTLPTAYLILEKIRLALAALEIQANGVRLKLTVTIGAEVLNLKNIQESIERSDKKMYDGKKRGKNVVVI